MTRTVAAFVVTGEFLTEHARNLVVEDQWDRAIRFLVENLHGMDWSIAISILDGTQRLVGSSSGPGIDLEEDPDAGEYLSRVNYVYAGRFPQGGQWYRPYAAVTGGYDERDASWAMERAGTTSVGLLGDTGWTSKRALFYATDRNNDRTFDIEIRGPEGPATVLWQRCNPAPPWMACTPNDPQAALRRFLTAGGVLDRVGAHLFRTQAALHSQRVREIDTTFDENVRRGIRGSTDILSVPEIAALSEERVDQAQRAREAHALAVEEAAEERAHETREHARLQRLHEAIVTQARTTSGFLTLRLGGIAYQVPRAPFENWCLWRTAGAHLAHPWAQVSGSGERMLIDDAYHTDWLLGAGVECFLRDRRVANLDARQAFRDDCYRAMHDLQERMLGFECTVLSGCGQAHGKVLHPKPDQEVPAGSILVIPRADPEYTIPALSAGPSGVVITEHGGELSHLGQIAMESRLRLVRVDDAVAKYPPGTEVMVDLDHGKVSISAGQVRGLFG